LEAIGQILDGKYLKVWGGDPFSCDIRGGPVGVRSPVDEL